MPLQSRHLGEILAEQGVISRDELHKALEQQKHSRGKHLGDLLVEAGLATREQINMALARKFGIPRVSLREFNFDAQVLDLLPADLVLQYNVVPLGEIDGRLMVAIENPLNWEVLSAVQFNANRTVEAVIAPGRDISEVLGRYYGRFEEDELRDLSANDTRKEYSLRLIEQEAMKKPVVRLVNAIILQAIMRHASDINIRPEKDRVNIYYRIDGKLQLQRAASPALLPALVSRIKILGRMNIAEHRLPQDGHARLMHANRSVDLRISIIPTVNGESVVIRILDREIGVKPLDRLGLTDQQLAEFKQLISQSFGMILVTGPTGSGKSTTLYALLNEIKKSNPHIITVEDPVEYEIAGVEQIQVLPITGYTFAEALRHILRHDPDVIMVGEIRDLETARISVKAALTGHLVLSTLHTNDAASTVVRLIDMGIEPYLLGSTLLGVLAQRLVRVNCPRCSDVDKGDPAIRRALKVSETEVFWRGKGCSACNYTGYRGRTMVSELLTVTPEIAQLISAARTSHEIKEAAVAQGMLTLTENAIDLARAGKTSLEEVFSVRLEWAQPAGS